MAFRELKTYISHQTFKFFLLVAGIVATIFIFFFLYQSNHFRNVEGLSYSRIEIIFNNNDRSNNLGHKQFVENLITNKYDTNIRYIKVAQQLSNNDILFCGTWAKDGILTHSVNEGRMISDFEIKGFKNIAIINHSFTHRFTEDDILYSITKAYVLEKEYTVVGMGSVYYPMLSYSSRNYKGVLNKAFPILESFLNLSNNYSWRSHNTSMIMIPLNRYLNDEQTIDYFEILIPTNQDYNEKLLNAEFLKYFPSSEIVTREKMIDFNEKAVRLQLVNYLLISIICLINILSLFKFWISSRKKSIAIFKLCGYTNRRIYSVLIKQLLAIYSIGFCIALIMYKTLIPLWYKLMSSSKFVYTSIKFIDLFIIYVAVLFFVWSICHKYIKRTSNMQVINILKGK